MLKMKIIFVILSLTVYAAFGLQFAQSLNASTFWDSHPLVAVAVWLVCSVAVTVYYAFANKGEACQ